MIEYIKKKEREVKRNERIIKKEKLEEEKSKLNSKITIINCFDNNDKNTEENTDE